MSELIVAPDVELSLIGGLRAANPYQNVLFGRGVAPEPREPWMVMLAVEYGRRLNVAQQEGVARINVWGPSGRYAETMAMAQWVAGQLILLADGKPVQKVHNQYGPTEVAEESKQTRLYLTVDLVFRIAERG